MNATDTLIAALSEVEEPIRAEIFGIERLAEHAESLAAAQRTIEEPSKGRNLLPKLRENGNLLLAAYRNIVEAVREKSEIAPAEEWLLDNFHVADEQLREIQDHLPLSYYRLLPKIASGHLEGYPRVYGLAWAYVAHTDSRFELATLQRFVRAYQRIQPLTIGELWAVVIHLRVALVAGLESILGLQKRGSALCIDPCIPRGWKGFEITYRHGDTLYRISVENPKGVCRGVSRVSLDGTLLPGEALVPLSDDGREHRVQVVLG